MSAIAITVEGVLRKPHGGAPIEAGIDLYYGMATRAKIVLLTAELQREGGLEHWLLVEGMAEHVRIVWADALTRDLSAGGERLSQLAKARQFGYDLRLVIEPDPAVAKRLIIAGYNVATFIHAEYSVPSWRPDAQLRVRPWDELEAQVDREAYLRRTDERKEEDKRATRA